MKVAVFGATGRVGALVVQALLDRGHEAVSVSRSAPSKQYSGKYHSRVGDMTDSAFIHSVLADCNGLIFCIGQRLKSEKNLFSKNLSPDDIRTQIVTPIIRVIGSDHLKRMVYLSAFGVGTDLSQHAFLFRMVLRFSSLGKSYDDHNQAETIVRASKTNWTIVRPPGLTDQNNVVPLVDSKGKWSSFMTVSKKSLAQYLVQMVENNNMDRQTLTVIEEISPMSV
jgi:uncharacterized protein YbjT (DUF2867 family)